MNNKRNLFVLIVLMALGGVLWTACKKSVGSGDSHQSSIKKAKYHCPMHPTYVSDKPDNCPICSMRTVPIDSGDPKKIKFYRNPMRPDVTSPVPKKDEMGMDYIPVYEGEEKAEVPVPRQAAINITSERRQLIGVKTAQVVEQPLTKVIYTSARVAYDPELYNAIAEYKQALEAKKKVQDSSWPDAQERAQALVRAARLRLRQLGLSDSQIENVNSDYQNDTNLLLSEKNESVWIYAQIFVSDIGLVKAGQTMEVTSPSLPGKKFFGTIKGVDTIMNSESRTLKARAEVPNPQGLLRPEMYMNAKINITIGNKLAVPRDAVINTGDRQIVFVDKGEGRYEPREVVLGQDTDNYFELISGLKVGERVITSANFLIDSESKLKAAIAGMESGQK